LFGNLFGKKENSRLLPKLDYSQFFTSKELGSDTIILPEVCLASQC
jgi:hypothetical protein